MLAAGLADVVVRDANPLVGGGVGRHLGDPGTVLLLPLAALAKGTSNLLHPVREVVTQGLQVAYVEHARTTRRPDLPLERILRVGRGEQGGELAFEPRDLLSEGPPRG